MSTSASAPLCSMAVSARVLSEFYEQVIVLDKSLESFRGGGELTVTVGWRSELEAHLERKDGEEHEGVPSDRVEFRHPKDSNIIFTYGAMDYARWWREDALP